jgi:ribosomal protein S14
MATSFEIAVAPDGSFDARLPERCVSCGAERAAETPITLSRLVARKQRQVPVTVRLKVPHCQACARASAWLFWIGLIPALTGFLLVGGAVFVAVFIGATWLGIDDYARPQDAPSLVLGAFFGLFGGLAGGLLAEVLTRLVLLPFLGRSMLRAPLFVVQMLTDMDYVAGLKAELASTGAQLRLTFENDAIAGEFASLNKVTR